MAPVVGFILVFAITVSLFTFISATVIPELAANKEAQTNDRVYSQLFRVSDTILGNAEIDRRENILLETQTNYLFADLAPVAKMNFEIDNSQELEYEISGYDGSEVFLNGKSGSSVTYTSDKIVLDPVLAQNDYSRMGIEHTVVHQDITTKQNIVNEDTIYLPLIQAEPNGYITGDNINVVIDTDSYKTTTVNVTGSDDFEIALETTLAEFAWDNTFNNEIDDGYINEVRYEYTADSDTNEVVIDFESNQNYTIKQAKSEVQFR